MKSPHLRRAMWRRPSFWISVVLLLGAGIVTVALLIVSANRDLSGLEQLLFQLIILAAGLAGTYMLGQQSAQDSARQLMKPAARSAFRRVLSLYASLERLSKRIHQLKAEGGNSSHDLDILEAVVQEQQASANDAMEDWRDLVPEEVDDVERRLKAATRSEEVEELEYGN